jgi:hypothetical protein
MEDTTVKKFYDIMKKSDNKTIKEEFKKFINEYTYYCDEFLGEGFFGRVTTPNFGPVVNVFIGNSFVSLPTAVKQLKHPDGKFSIYEQDGKLYMVSEKTLTSEMIMLYMVSKLWYDERTPHLPFLLGVDSCGDIDSGFISKIVTERHGIMSWFNGLEKPIILRDRFKTPFWLTRQNHVSNMATLDDLFLFCLLNRESETKITLPNGKTVYIPDLLDYLFISYVHTAHILYKDLHLILSDQHSTNIFIHWLGKFSRMGKTDMSNVDRIYYQIEKDKYIKCDTYGILLKLGDLGTCVMKPRDDVYVIGDVYDQDKHIKDFRKYDSYVASYIDMFMNIVGGTFPQGVISKTRVWKLCQKAPFNTITYLGTPVDVMLPTELEVLNADVFKDMVVDKVSKDANNIVVSM